MACPHSESIYCIPSSSLSHTDRSAYSGTSGASAGLSLIGSAWTLHLFWPLLSARYTGPRLPSNPQIIFYLAVADLIACLAVILRSIALGIIKEPKDLCSNFTTTNCSDRCSGANPSYCLPHSVSYIYFGAPIEIILRFAYIATFMWTLVFAVDTYRRARTKEVPNSAYYHVFVWIVSAVLAGSHPVIVFVGIGTRCADKYRLIGSYFLLYLPMLVVMIVNPILYFCTKRSYEQRHREGGWIAAEVRKKMKDYKAMFSIYTAIFYICWVPSLVNLVFSIITPFVDSVSSVPFPIWILNAITNPLQGFLNSLSYGRFRKSIFTDRRQGSIDMFSESNREKDSLV